MCHAGLWLLPFFALIRAAFVGIEGALADPVWLAVLAGLALACAFALGYGRRPSLLASAVELDRRLAAGGAISAAFELRDGASSGYVALVALQAEQRLHQADLGRALPLQRPPLLGPLALVLAAFLAVLTIRQPGPSGGRAKPMATTETPSEALAALAPEELSLLAARAQRLLAAATSNAGRERALEYADLIQRLQAGALDRRSALSAAANLERDILDEAERGQLRAEDRDGSHPSATSEGSQAGSKTEEGDRRLDSAEALERLAERLAQETSPPSARELDEIRQNVDKAREQARREHQATREQQGQAAQRLRDKERRLLAKQQKGELSKEDAAELEDTRRKLERLERSQKTAEQEQSELDRQLSEAMRELAGDPKEAGRFLDRAAGSQRQKEDRQLTDEEKRELLEQLRALKERLRQGEQSDMEDKLRQFERRARGEEQPGGEGSGQGQGQGPRPGSSPGAKGAAGQGPPSGEGTDSAQAELGSTSSPEPGSEHDPNWQGEATKGLDAKPEDKAAAARDTGQGSSESETILTAAERGFRASSYERLYKDYRTVLEEMVKGEAISRSRRSEVERYFDLIRPRSE